MDNESETPPSRQEAEEAPLQDNKVPSLKIIVNGVISRRNNGFRTSRQAVEATEEPG